MQLFNEKLKHFVSNLNIFKLFILQILIIFQFPIITHHNNGHATQSISFLYIRSNKSDQPLKLKESQPIHISKDWDLSKMAMHPKSHKVWSAKSLQDKLQALPLILSDLKKWPEEPFFLLDLQVLVRLLLLWPLLKSSAQKFHFAQWLHQKSSHQKLKKLKF